MASFKVTINTDNAAFEGETHEELVRILRRLANKLDDNLHSELEGMPITLRDINGNTVGKASFGR